MHYKLAVAAFVASALASPQLPTLTSSDQYSIQTAPNTPLTTSDSDGSSSLANSDVSGVSSTTSASDSLISSASGSLSSALGSLSSDLSSLVATSSLTGVILLSGTSSVTASTGLPINSSNSTIPFRASTRTPSPSNPSGSGSATTSSGSGSGSGSGQSSSSTSPSHNGATMPTAVMGMGFAGVVGLVGALAL